MTYVVLDTNVIDKDRDLRGKWNRALLAASRGDYFTVVLPEVVVVGLIEHQKVAFDKAIRQMRAAKDLLSWVVETEAPDMPEAESLAGKYEKRLRSKIEDSGGLLASLPDVGHDELLRWAVEKRLPFRGHDAGYRDALIWHTVLDLAKEEDIAFCTENVKDFLTTSGDTPTLAPVLLDDLEARSISSDSVVAFTSVEAFVRDQITTDPLTFLADETEETAVALASAVIASDGRSWIEDRLNDLVWDGVDEATIQVMSADYPEFVEPLDDFVTSDISIDDVLVEHDQTLVSKDRPTATLFLTIKGGLKDRYGYRARTMKGTRSDGMEPTPCKSKSR